MDGSLRDPLAFIALCLLLLSTPARADNDVSFDELPHAVQQAAKREIGNGTVVEVEVDEEPTGLIYEIEFVLNEVAYEIDIAEDGRVIDRKRD